MAELHVVGEIIGAQDYSLPSLFCKYTFDTGGNFRLLQGHTAGQTHCDMPPVRLSRLLTDCPPYMARSLTDTLWHAQEGEAATLSHPIDVHYAVKGIDGWPRLRLEVYGMDQYGRIELAGYGCCIVPTSPGTHELRCPTWRPCGTLREQFWTFFLGGTPRLKHTEVISSSADRFRLQTEPAGDVLLRLSVLPKDLARYGVIC